MTSYNQQTTRTIFVFGSNEAGRHGKGAALEAVKRGAVYGQGRGLAGDTYAIPTKDKNLKTRPLHKIQIDVEVFLIFAAHLPDWIFEVTALGTGLAGYSHAEMAPMFRGAPKNVVLPEEWKPWLNKNQLTKKWKF